MTTTGAKGFGIPDPCAHRRTLQMRRSSARIVEEWATRHKYVLRKAVEAKEVEDNHRDETGRRVARSGACIPPGSLQTVLDRESHRQLWAFPGCLL